ncbi:MAG TPA: MerR family transcriptional regulator [Elusimicrobiota bacterium]|nr:MerR family transcriptional regulator [Elusimicrobiota bacterium]
MGRLDRPVRRTRSTPIYTIGAAARLTGIPIWTLRWIEKHGLLRPDRTAGRQRLYSDHEMDLLRDVRDLMEQKVNLAGIRVILKMRHAPAGR